MLQLTRILAAVLLAGMSLSAQFPAPGGVVSGGSGGGGGGGSADYATTASKLGFTNTSFVFVGDSITAGAGATAGRDYPSVAFGLANLTGSGNTKTNLGVGGYTVPNIMADYAANVRPLSPSVTGKAGYLFVDIGTNDAASSVAATTIKANLASYWATAQADGWNLVAFTLIPMAGNPASRNIRADVNAYIRASNTLWDFLVDVESLLPDPYNSNQFQLDRLHPTDGGYATIANAVNQALGVRGNMLASVPLVPLGTGEGNVRFNFSAGIANTTGLNNIFGGDYAGAANTTGFSNVFLGSQAGYNNLGGSRNTFIGNQAGNATVAGTENTYIADYAGQTATGSFNTGIGRAALFAATGNQNVAIGQTAGFALAGGANNVLIGQSSGATLTSGSGNVLLGRAADVSAAAATGRAQIGAGSNAINNTLQFMTFNFLTATGDATFASVQWVTGTRPTCNAANRFKTWAVAGAAGALDTFEVCRKDAADAYAWVSLF